MYKTIAILDEVADVAKRNEEIMFLMTDKRTIDLFIERHGGERCTDKDGNRFVLFEGCKIHYRTEQFTDAESIALSSTNFVDGRLVEAELTLHRESLQHFKRWGSEIK